MTPFLKIEGKTVVRAVKEIVSARITPASTEKRLQRENPEFVEGVASVARRGGYINDESIMAGAMIAYRLLELQQRQDVKYAERALAVFERE